jgi:hypothetical protein
MPVTVVFEPALLPPEDAASAPLAVPMALVDHEAKAYARLPVQFRQKPDMRALVRSRSLEAQEIEVVLMQLRLLLSIDDVEGYQLDVIGKILHQRRDDRDDPTYRVWLKARARLRNSHATAKDVLEVLRLAAGSGPEIAYFNTPPACFVVRMLSLSLYLNDMRELLTLATAAGVRSLLVHSTYPLAETFRFDVGPGLDQGHLAGVLDVAP